MQKTRKNPQKEGGAEKRPTSHSFPTGVHRWGVENKEELAESLEKMAYLRVEIRVFLSQILNLAYGVNDG